MPSTACYCRVLAEHRDSFTTDICEPGLRLAVWTSMDAARYVVYARIGTFRCLTPLSFCFRSSMGSSYIHMDFLDFRRLVIWHSPTPSYNNPPPPAHRR